MTTATSVNEVKTQSPTETTARKRGCFFYINRGLVGIGVLLVVVAVVAFIFWSRGLIQFPALTGNFPVGKVDLHLVDTSRPEVFSDAPDDVRELMVTLYYPANPPAGASPAPFTQGIARDMFATTVGTPGFLQDSVRSHAFADVPVANSGNAYPVIVFSPGMGFLPITYTPTLEEIASHGYIVASVSHPYSTLFTVFPDGRVVRSTPQAGSKALSQAAAQSTTAEALESVTNPIGAVWVGDVRFVLDQLTAMNASDALLAGHLDLSRVGVMGHSFGGGTAAEVMAQDNRFLAGINMDGTFYGASAHNGVQRPFMLMSSERIPLSAEQATASGSSAEAYAFSQKWEATTQATIYNSAASGYRLTLNGSTHRTFISFEPIAAPVLFIPTEMVGKIPGERAVSLVTTYVLGFFDKHLKGQVVALLDGASSDYPEVQFESRGA